MSCPQDCLLHDVVAASTGQYWLKAWGSRRRSVSNRPCCHQQKDLLQLDFCVQEDWSSLLGNEDEFINCGWNKMTYVIVTNDCNRYIAAVQEFEGNLCVKGKYEKGIKQHGGDTQVKHGWRWKMWTRERWWERIDACLWGQKIVQQEPQCMLCYIAMAERKAIGYRNLTYLEKIILTPSSYGFPVSR